MVKVSIPDTLMILDVFPKNIIVYLQGVYLKNRVGEVGLWLGSQHNYVWTNLLADVKGHGEG